ncbi:hypothetical protein LCGC14_2639990, partial [marine sediment metagenome]
DGTLTVEAPGVLGNDHDGDGDLLTAELPLFETLGGPSHGTLDLQPDGSFVYTPVGDYFGTDAFSYRAHDGLVQSSLAEVAITVDPVNDAPVGVEDRFDTYLNTPLSVPAPGVLGNDVDVEGDSLTATLVDPPSDGTLELNPDGSFLYTPDTGFSGVDSFTYTANDAAAESDPVEVTLTVLAAGLSGTVFEDLDANGLRDPGEGPLADWTVLLQLRFDGPISTTLTDADGYYSFTGLQRATYRVWQEVAEGYTRTFPRPAAVYTLNLGQGETIAGLDFGNVHDRPPEARDDAYKTDENETLTVAVPGVLANDYDPDDDLLTAVLIAGVAHGSLWLVPDGSFRYEPEEDFFGTDSFTYQAYDGVFFSDTATVEITVSSLNEAPQAVDAATLDVGL